MCDQRNRVPVCFRLIFVWFLSLMPAFPPASRDGDAPNLTSLTPPPLSSANSPTHAFLPSNLASPASRRHTSNLPTRPSLPTRLATRGAFPSSYDNSPFHNPPPPSRVVPTTPPSPLPILPYFSFALAMSFLLAIALPLSYLYVLPLSPPPILFPNFDRLCSEDARRRWLSQGNGEVAEGSGWSLELWRGEFALLVRMERLSLSKLVITRLFNRSSAAARDR